MADALQAESRFSQILQCPICLETFKRPKVLPCGHTYCSSCLQLHISNKVIHRETPQICFPCPVCRLETPSLDPNIIIEQWAESLPVNSIVFSLLDVTVGNKAGKSCNQCLKQGKESLATYFCKDCDQSMCMTCKQYHDGFPSLSRHNIIKVSDGDVSSFVIPNLSTIKLCPRHSGERIKFFCGDHRTMCCNTCVILEHRKCDQVITIDDMLKSLDKKTLSQEVETNLSNFKEHLKTITQKIKANGVTIQKDKDNILQHIHSLKDRLFAKLQKVGKDVIASLESNYKSENLNLQTEETKGQGLITAIDSDRTQLELVMTHGSDEQKAIMLHNLDLNQHRYIQLISEYQKNLKECKISFDVAPTFQTFVDTISEVGKIHLIHKDFDCSPCQGTFGTPLRITSESVPIQTPLKKGKAVKVTEFNVKVSGDTRTCHISDILHLKDSRMLLIDRYNFNIKMFGHDYKCQESLKLQGSPWSVCSLSDTEVAVTIPHEKKIQIFEIKEKMLKVREIRTRLGCWGIASTKDHLVITTSEDQHSILILDMNGKEITIVRTDTYRGEKLLDPLHIKTDRNNSVTYISYQSVDILVAYSMTWEVLFTYSNPNLISAAGVDTDREGTIYLCGYNSHSVQQISEEGKLIKVLIAKKKKENMSPFIIRFYKDKDSFIVTYGESDVVEVYEIRV